MDLRSSVEGKGVCAVVLAGNVRIRRERARRRRRGLLYRLTHPSLWTAERELIESMIASQINKDDYIVGENKSLLYLHPDLSSLRNINYLKRILYFAGKTGDRLYRKKKHDLLQYLSVSGEASLTLVLRGVLGSDRVDRDMVFVVGPSKQISQEILRSGIGGVHVIEQGGSIGENILRGKEAALRKGYRGDHMLVIGGDTPLVSPGAIESFLRSAKNRGFGKAIHYGVASRSELAIYIKDHDLESMGRVGPNRPKKGNLNKFGAMLVDDLSLFGKDMDREHMMVGNMFLYRMDSVDRHLMDRFYSLRKMGANPFIYPRLFYHFGRPLLRSFRWKLKASDAEKAFERFSGVGICLTPVPPEMALDIDSYTDLRRLSFLEFRRMRPAHDLETDLVKYTADRRRERQKAKRAGKAD